MPRFNTPSSLQGVMLNAGATGGSDLAQAQSIGNLYAVGALAGLPSTIADTLIDSVPSETDELNKQQTLSGIMLNQAHADKYRVDTETARRQLAAVESAQNRIRSGEDPRLVLADFVMAGSDYAGKAPDVLPMYSGYQMSDAYTKGMPLEEIGNRFAPIQLGAGKGWQDTRPGMLEKEDAATDRTGMQITGAMDRTRYTTGQMNARHQQTLEQNANQFNAREGRLSSQFSAAEQNKDKRLAMKDGQPGSPSAPKKITVPSSTLAAGVARFQSLVDATAPEQYKDQPFDSRTIDIFKDVYRRYLEAGYPDDDAFQESFNYVTKQYTSGGKVELYKSDALAKGGSLPTPAPYGQSAQPQTVKEGTVVVNPNTKERLVMRGGKWAPL